VNASAPREFIGWAESIGILAREANALGDHAKAKALCANALAHITDEDRDYVTLFLDLDIEMANAQAGLGEVDAALARIDGLLQRFRDCDHPLVLGCLHEARAAIAWKAGRVEEYAYSLALVDHWFRPTGTPALIAKCERLAALRGGVSTGRWPQLRAPDSSSLADAVTKLQGEKADASGPMDAPTAVALARRRESA
jgi:hypothetical protein